MPNPMPGKEGFHEDYRLVTEGAVLVEGPGRLMDIGLSRIQQSILEAREANSILGYSNRSANTEEGERQGDLSDCSCLSFAECLLEVLLQWIVVKKCPSAAAWREWAAKERVPVGSAAAVDCGQKMPLSCCLERMGNKRKDSVSLNETE
ncbi:hypothetical protein HGM15179_001438 [Zosterops borbonicus]|uniref:Uncharacterized protein n=1 Tax=Zosterops borbonicus TaxID=364589 RepID=A0A8K1GX24_9PASS|nr:hypothetical protein HGM15179_001438 [Zosterops borbonicus]